MENQGKFLSFEGGEGSGKTTQIKLLKEKLEEKNKEVLLTREPGGSAGGEEIRNLLVTGATNRWEPMTELLLLYAARHDHVEKVIKPALAAGKIVICDRFSDSTLAYQGYGHGLGAAKIKAIHQAVMHSFAPNRTFILDLPVEMGLKRAFARHDGEDRYENMDLSFHQKMRDGYLAIAAEAKERVTVIDATGSIDDVHNLILADLKALF